MSQTVVVAGVGMVPFTKPGTSEPYYDMGAEAARRALADAGVDYKRVQQAYVGYVYGDSTCGQRALYPVGMTGIPVINVNNNCSTGSTALFLARQAVQSGAADCVIALGFEQMKPGALGSYFHDRPSPFEPFDTVCDELVGQRAPPAHDVARHVRRDDHPGRVPQRGVLRQRLGGEDVEGGAVEPPLLQGHQEVLLDDGRAPAEGQGVTSRELVADVITFVIAEDAAVRETVNFYDGSVPLAEAIG